MARSDIPRSYRTPDDLEEWVKAVLTRDNVTFTALVDRLMYAERSRETGLYRTKPGVAVKGIPVADLLTKPAEDLPLWVQDAIRRNIVRVNGDRVNIMTQDGDRPAWLDGWLMQGTEEEIYSIKASVFNRKYDPLGAPS